MEATSFDSLPDEDMLAILGYLREGKLVARCAPVCRRWRNLVRNVARLSFTMGVTTPKAIEGMTEMLQRAVGLREVKIFLFRGGGLSGETVYEWIRSIRTSVENLDMAVCGVQCPELWRYIRKCPKLRKLRIYGGIGMFPKLKTTLTNLRECEMSNSYPDMETLESIVQQCPKLEKLAVKGYEGWKVKLISNSLVDLWFKGASFVMVEAPNLKYLTLDEMGCVLYGPKLIHLRMLSRIKDLIVVSLDSLELLTMHGDTWEIDEIQSVVELTPTVIELKINASVTDPKPISWRKFFQPLERLQILSLGGNVLECFCKEMDVDVMCDMKIVRATFYLDEMNRKGALDLVSEMKKHCSELKLVTLNCCGLKKKKSNVDVDVVDDVGGEVDVVGEVLSSIMSDEDTSCSSACSACKVEVVMDVDVDAPVKEQPWTELFGFRTQ